MQVPRLIYCELWNVAERQAFWRGFLDRAEGFSDELKGYFVWFLDAFGMGDTDGDFSAAWTSFGSALGVLLELAYKVTIVVGIVPLSILHPKRRRYASELTTLGLKITQEFINGYKEAYKEGDIPQCTGRLLADMLRIVFEIALAKGATAGVSAMRSSRVLAKIKLPKSANLPDRVLPKPSVRLPIKRPPTRLELAEFFGDNYNKGVQPAGAAAQYGRGITPESGLQPGQFLVRVEARSPVHNGNWFRGPFKSAHEANAYAQQLADTGIAKIRQEMALPHYYINGAKKGNAVEVVRVYKVNHPTPYAHSISAHQKEGLQATKARAYLGQRPQVELPNRNRVREKFKIDLVEAVPGPAVLIKKQ